MLALSVLKYFWEDIWFFEEEDMFDYIQRVIASIFIIIPVLVVFSLDILLSPIEIIAFIVWKYKQRRR